MTAAGRKIALSGHIGIEWLAPHAAAALCPNCGARGTVRQVLDIEYRPPDDDDRHRFILQRCPACTVLFTDNRQMMDYSTEKLIRLGWDSYQVQLGAGLWPIAAQIARLEKPRGARVLEIGGAYGFGLDFCTLARGWTGEGYDPSPLAAFGMRELGLRIRQEYFTVRNIAEGPWDVAIATELIEHVSYPVAFLLLMRRALGERGVLILSTPDAGFVTPELPPDSLLPLLSPGAHTVLQTAQSLELALRQAGFTHIRVVPDGTTLTAYASAAPFNLSDDLAAQRAMYRAYLVSRAARAGLEGDLRLGLAGRGVFEAANDGDWAAADAAWAALLPAVQARFGLDLETMQTLPPGAAEAELGELTRLMPLGLGMILFGRAMRRLDAGQTRALVEPMLRLAAAAVAALLQALAQRSLTDGISVSLAGLLHTELLICAAAAGRADAVAGLAALNDEATSWRGFVELVNAGAIGLAAALKQHLPAQPGPAIPPGLTRDALLSLVNFHLAEGGAPREALPGIARLQAGGEDMDEALLGVFTRLVNAGCHEAAQDLAAQHDLAGLARRLAGRPAGQDAAMALALLALTHGDPAAIATPLAELPLTPAQTAALVLEAFARLVHAARYDDAMRFSAAQHVPALLAQADPPSARHAQLAALTLELAAGDPALVPGQMEQLGLDMAQRAPLLLQAFIRLVNAARYAEARGFAARYDILALLRHQGDEIATDAVAGLAMLELAAGDPALVPGLLAGHDLAHTQRADLLLGAFTSLVNAGRCAEAEELRAAEALFQELEQRPGVAAENARWAGLILDLQRGRPLQAAHTAAMRARADGYTAPLASVYADAFVRLMNEGDYAGARTLSQDDTLETCLALCPPAARHDVLTALLMLDCQPEWGMADAVPARLEALATAGMDEARVTELGFHAFSALVNQAAFAAAAALRPLVEPALAKLTPPFAPPARDALFAAGMLYLQSKDDWRRGAAMFARLRDGLVKLTPKGESPDPLFWPTLRGEVVTLNQLNRGAEAVNLLQSFLDAYPGAPDDLREQIKGESA